LAPNLEWKKQAGDYPGLFFISCAGFAGDYSWSGSN
jgi:hypothetical protein